VRLLDRSLRPSLGQRVVDWSVQRFARKLAPLILLVWLAGGALRLVGWLLRRPRLLVALAGLAGVAWLLGRYGWVPFAVAGAATLVALGAWSRLHPATYNRAVRLPARARRRRLRYRHRWQPATSTAGLTIRTGRHEHLPELLAVRSTREVDRVRVRMLPGQTVVDWSEQGERLAQSFGVLDVRARAVPRRPHEVELLALVVDPLVDRVALPEPADPVNLAAVPVGVQEDGEPLTLPVWRPGRGSTHLLVAGVTGAGKGSAVWSLLGGLGPAIRDGFVSVWAVDPKGGAELGGGRALFDRFVRGGPVAGGAPWQTAIADLLDDAVAGMQARLVAMEDPRRPGGPVRWHTPTPQEPAILVVVDEVGSLTAWGVPADLRRRIEGALSLLLSQGRAAAVSVILATQDPRKETLAFRDLIPVRLALRTVEPVADLILGAGMRARGARTDRIAPELPGVVYLLPEGSAEPVRGRLAYVDDEQLADLARRYAPRPPEPAPAEPLYAPSTRVPA
jgi:S-DNA-T family DNA segregation ATPase FtsK/SpoIIIE